MSEEFKILFPSNVFVYILFPDIVLSVIYKFEIFFNYIDPAKETKHKSFAYPFYEILL